MSEEKEKPKVGRPTKYKDEFCQKLIDFFDVEPYEDIEIPHYDKSKGKSGGIIVWEDVKRMPNKLPTLRDFAKSISVHVSNVYEWLNEESNVYHKEFRDAFMYAKDIRKDFLIQNGLQGLYPPLSFKFVAVNLTDMRDHRDITSGGKAIQQAEPLTIQEMKERIKAAEKAGNGVDNKSIEGNGNGDKTD